MAAGSDSRSKTEIEDLIGSLFDERAELDDRLRAGTIDRKDWVKRTREIKGSIQNLYEKVRELMAERAAAKKKM